jgi:uncharacterized protein YjbJ (UPF0337 family)
MDKDRIVGSAKQIKGTVKQVAGKAVGDAKLEAEGNADKIEGQVQNAIGGVKDTLKGKYNSRELVLLVRLGILPIPERQGPFIWRHRWFLNP